MTEEQLRTFQALSQKRMALFAFLQTTLTDENRDVLGPAMHRANLELQLVSATISDLLNGAPLNFPSHEELDRIRQLSAQVAAGVAAVAAFAALVEATDALINAWPTL